VKRLQALDQVVRFISVRRWILPHDYICYLLSSQQNQL